MKVLKTVRTFSFWGAFLFLSLVVGFRVSIWGIVSDALNAELPIKVLCVYAIASIFVFFAILLFDILSAKNSAITVQQQLIYGFHSTVWTPYKGFAIGELFKFKRLGMSKSAIAYDVAIMIWRLLEMIAWWCIVAGIVFHTRRTPECAISKAFAQLSTIEIRNRILIIVVSIIVLNLLAWMLDEIDAKKLREGANRTRNNSRGTLGQRYFDKHPERIPSGCRSCGGPYPECRASCSLFDE